MSALGSSSWEVLALLGTWTWKASLVALLVLALQTLAGSRLPPRWRYGLWSLVALRLLLPVAPPSAMGLFAAGAPSASGSRLPGLGEIVPTAVSPAAQAETATRIPNPELLGLLLLAIWTIGVVVSLARELLRRRAWRRRLQGARRVHDPRVQEILEEGRARLGILRPVEVQVSETVPTAAVAGLLRPRIVMNPRLLQSLGRESLRHVVFHELAHLRQGDPWIHLLTRLLLAFHWFNPWLSWTGRRVQDDRELACDALALAALEARQARAYGRTLLTQVCPGTVPLAGPSFTSPSKTALRRRIAMISHYRPTTPLTRMVLALAFAVTALTALTERPVEARAVGNPSAATQQTDLEAQRETVATLRNLGTALFAWLMDHPQDLSQKDATNDGSIDWSACRELSADEAREMLADYIDPMPEKDGWADDLEVCFDPANPDLTLGIRSAGSDGTFAGPVYPTGAFCPTETANDLVWVSGYFITWPNRDAC